MSIGALSTSSAIHPPPPPSNATTAAAQASPSAPSAATVAPSSTTKLSSEALALVDKLKARDTEVRQHEQAHLAAAGGLATSGASYSYQRGPNGVDYAIGGEVNIDTSPGATPQETIDRARTIQTAALAPAEPSGADRAVAAQAQQMALQARAELAQRAYSAAPSAAPTVDIRA
jgi:hypothetical protein